MCEWAVPYLVQDNLSIQAMPLQWRKLLNKPSRERRCPVGLLNKTHPSEQIQQPEHNKKTFPGTHYKVLCTTTTTSDIDDVPDRSSGSYAACI